MAFFNDPAAFCPALLRGAQLCAELLGEPFLKKGFPPNPLPKTFNAFWRGHIRSGPLCGRPRICLTLSVRYALAKKNGEFRQGGLRKNLFSKKVSLSSYVRGYTLRSEAGQKSGGIHKKLCSLYRGDTAFVIVFLFLGTELDLFACEDKVRSSYCAHLAAH